MAHVISEPKLREWMTRLGPRLLNVATGVCHDRHRAEEIVQEAFIKLWKNPPDGGEHAYGSWLRRVVTNLAINHIKRAKRPGKLPEFSADPALQVTHKPYEAIDDQDNVDRIRVAIGRLDDSKRAILVLRAYEQLSYDEIAEHLGVPVGTVMSRLNRARAALREELEAIENEAREESVVYRFKQQA